MILRIKFALHFWFFFVYLTVYHFFQIDFPGRFSMPDKKAVEVMLKNGRYQRDKLFHKQ